MKEQQAKLLAEKNEVLNDNSLVAEEKSRMLNDLKVKLTIFENLFHV